MKVWGKSDENASWKKEPDANLLGANIMKAPDFFFLLLLWLLEEEEEDHSFSTSHWGQADAGQWREEWEADCELHFGNF